MKTFLKFIFALVIVALVTYIGNASFGFIGAIAGFLCSLVVIIAVNRANFLFFTGLIFYGRNNHKTAYSFMKKAYETTKLAPKKALLYSYMLIRDGILSDAEAILNKVTYLNSKALTKSDLLEAAINRAIILWKKEDIAGAIEILEEKYDDGVVSTTLYGTLGYFYILNNQISKGEAFNKEAYEYNSDNAVIADNLAYNYILMSEFEKAEEIYKKLLSTKPSFIEPYYNYALLLEKRMEIPEAIEYYKKALKYEEKYLSIITHKDINDAIERLEKSKITLNKPSEEDKENQHSEQQSTQIENTDNGN